MKTLEFMLITSAIVVAYSLGHSEGAVKTKDVNVTSVTTQVQSGSTLLATKIAEVKIPEPKVLTIQEKAYNYLVEDLRLSRNHALGLIANVERESRWKVDVAKGLFQWHGKRYRNMETEVPDWSTNWKAQLAYAVVEDVGPEWCLMNFKTAEEASAWWCRHWERPANISRDIVKNNKFLELYEF